jgi:hypothetical protein
MGKAGISGTKNKPPGLFDLTESRGLLNIVVFYKNQERIVVNRQMTINYSAS